MTRRCPDRGDTRWLACFGVFLLLLVTAGAPGCGTVSYKLGGTQGDYQAASDRCKNTGRTQSPDFERCMKEQEWIVKRLGGPAAPSDPKKRAPAEGSVPAERASGGLPSAPVAGDVAPSTEHGEVPSVERPAIVNSWFKLGGTADAFAAAKERCVAKLGAAHRPEPESQAFTGEMLGCLRDQGWRGMPSD